MDVTRIMDLKAEAERHISQQTGYKVRFILASVDIGDEAICTELIATATRVWGNEVMSKRRTRHLSDGRRILAKIMVSALGQDQRTAAGHLQVDRTSIYTMVETYDALYASNQGFRNEVSKYLNALTPETRARVEPAIT